MEYYFKAFGLNIQSEFPFQGINIPEKGFFDISVTKGKFVPYLQKPIVSGLSFESDYENMLLKIPNVANFLIKDGKEVIIDKFDSSELREVELFFMGSVMAVILMQRGIVPFHGSAFEKEGKCIIISGNSGAGKSTLLRNFIEQGFRALTDDVCALSIKDGKVILTPSYPSSKIWADVMSKYNLTKTKENQVRPEIEKYKHSFSDKFCNTPLEVEAVYILKSKNTNQFSMDEVKGFEKFKALKLNLYRPKFPEATNKEKETFIILNKLASQSKLYHLTRSTSINLLESFNEFSTQNILK